MPVTSIRYVSGPRQKAPRTGDRRTTKKHGLQIRIPEVVTFGPHRGAHVHRNGRPAFEWCKPAELPPRYRHYLTAEERAALEQKRPAP